MALLRCCDYCGCIINENDTYTAAEIDYYRVDGLKGKIDPKSIKKDICNDCSKKIEEFIKNIKEGVNK